ncbi:MAG TPA: hypothetical protein ENI23_09195 [bacterium]|nr:hypothetical protein [bacterium]
MITLEKVLARHRELCDSARDLIEKKGHDYNRGQQLKGDTLFNLRVAKMLGIVDTNTKSVLTRFCDKVMRLISLTSEPNITASVKDESIKDTIRDIINYGVYIELFYEEMQEEHANTPKLVAND